MKGEILQGHENYPQLLDTMFHILLGKIKIKHYRKLKQPLNLNSGIILIIFIIVKDFFEKNSQPVFRFSVM